MPFLAESPMHARTHLYLWFIPDQFALAPDSVTRKKPGSGLLGPNQILADIYNEEEVTMKIALMTSRIWNSMLAMKLR